MGVPKNRSRQSLTGELLLKQKLIRRGINYSLDRLTPALNKLGHPQLFHYSESNHSKNSPSVIHVAGTNGKGSVCHYLTQALCRLNMTVLTYTSPHIINYNERICINGTPISDELFNELLFDVNDIDESNALSEFEILTLMAFIAAQRVNVDVLVLETGLGGRLDATNVVSNSMAVITDIGLDHCDILGESLVEIAKEKAGIIKPEAIVVTHSDHSPSVQAVIQSESALKNAKLIYSPSQMEFDQRNRSLSLVALRHFYRCKGISDFSINSTCDWILTECQRPFGRLCKLSINGTVCMADVGHNLAAVKAIYNTLTGTNSNQRYHWVVGMQMNKFPQSVICWLLSKNQHVFICEYDDTQCITMKALDNKLQKHVHLWRLNDPTFESTIFFGSFYFFSWLLKNGATRIT